MAFTVAQLEQLNQSLIQSTKKNIKQVMAKAPSDPVEIKKLLSEPLIFRITLISLIIFPKSVKSFNLCNLWFRQLILNS